jgi:hypothetical protein
VDEQAEQQGEQQPDKPADKPKRPKGFQKGNPYNRTGDKHKSRKNVLIAALKQGALENAEWLKRFTELVQIHGLGLADALRLIRIGIDPDTFYLKGPHLAKGLEIEDLLAAKVKATKTPVVPVSVKLDAKQQAQLLAERQAILDGKVPVQPVVSPILAPAVTEKPAKPIPTDDRPEWFKQMTGVGKSWEWKIPEAVVETVRPPNKYEKVVLPDIVDGYNPPLQAEGVTLTTWSTGSIRAGFDKHKNISFEKTDHIGNSIVGSVVVKAPGIGTQVFPKIRQSYFKLWQSHNYKPEYAPSDMRESYRAFLQSLDSVILPTGQNTTPTLDGAGYESKLAVKVEYPRGIKARRWGTAIDDARKTGPRHVYGESLGTDLAQMYVDMDKIKGFDL